MAPTMDIFLRRSIIAMSLSCSRGEEGWGLDSMGGLEVEGRHVRRWGGEEGAGS